MDSGVTVNDLILEYYGFGIYIKIGYEITVKDLLYGLMLFSGNELIYIKQNCMN